MASSQRLLSTARCCGYLSSSGRVDPLRMADKPRGRSRAHRRGGLKGQLELRSRWQPDHRHDLHLDDPPARLKHAVDRLLIKHAMTQQRPGRHRRGSAPAILTRSHGDLFPRPAGLADGLALKELRYSRYRHETRPRPTWVPGSLASIRELGICRNIPAPAENIRTMRLKRAIISRLERLFRKRLRPQQRLTRDPRHPPPRRVRLARRLGGFSPSDMFGEG